MLTTAAAIAGFALVGTALRAKLAEVAGRPVGTLLANLLGTAVFAFVVATTHPDEWSGPLVVGGAGALSTWSTFVVEVYQTLVKRAWAAAAVYTTATLGGTICLAWWILRTFGSTELFG